MTFEQLLENLLDKSYEHECSLARTGDKDELEKTREGLASAKKAVLDSYYGNWTHYEKQDLDPEVDYEIASMDGRFQGCVTPAKWSPIAGFVNSRSNKRIPGVEWFRVKRQDRMPSYD